MIEIGDLRAQRGEKVFGFLEAARTHADFPVHVPIHVIAGSHDGPTLLVQAGLSGMEIEPAMVLPNVVEALDPQAMSGTLLLVPLLNTSGFEFEQVRAIWDDQDLNTLGKGRPDGTVSEQLLHHYYTEAVSQADALIDIHTGALWGYFQYAGVYQAGDIDAGRSLATALGLPQVLVGQPEDRSLAFEAAKDGKQVVSLWIGGGPGLRDHRVDDQARVRAAIFNALKHLGIISGIPESDVSSVDVIQAHTILKLNGNRGLTFIAKEKRGRAIEADEVIGYVRHPFTGQELEKIRAPRAGIMLHAGASWPVVPEGETLAILGDLLEQIDRSPA